MGTASQGFNAALGSLGIRTQTPLSQVAAMEKVSMPLSAVWVFGQSATLTHLKDQHAFQCRSRQSGYSDHATLQTIARDGKYSFNAALGSLGIRTGDIPRSYRGYVSRFQCRSRQSGYSDYGEPFELPSGLILVSMPLSAVWVFGPENRY